MEGIGIIVGLGRLLLCLGRFYGMCDPGIADCEEVADVYLGCFSLSARCWMRFTVSRIEDLLL